MPVAVLPSKVIQGLPTFGFRGVKVDHYDLVSTKFEHEQAGRHWPYVDGDGHDFTGRRSLQFGIRAYYLNTLKAGAFPGDWLVFRDAILDGSPGELEHPLLGSMPCVVKGGAFDLKASTTAGIIVEVQFEEDVPDPNTPTLIGSAGINILQLAQAADAACAAIVPPVKYPGPDFSIFGAITRLKGMIFAFELNATSQIAGVMANISGMISTIENLDNPNAWPGLDTLLGCWGGLDAMSKTIAAQVRSTRSLTTTRPTTLDAFAALQGNTLQEIMGLNIAALASPVVPKGTVLSYYP